MSSSVEVFICYLMGNDMIAPQKSLHCRDFLRTISYILLRRFWVKIAYYLVYIDMVLTDTAREYFLSIQFRVRQAAAKSPALVPFDYEDESFFSAYEAVTDVWKNRKPQRIVAESLNISRNTLKDWDHSFALYGSVGLLPEISQVQVDPALERLAVLVKLSRPHERASHALRLAEALEIEDASLERIRQIQRSYGYGQRMDEADIDFWSGLQHILESVAKQKEKSPLRPVHNLHDRAGTFFNYQRDHLQHRVELFKALSNLQKKRQVRPILQEFGMAPNRFYVLKNRYMLYGVWGLADLVQKGQTGEKISPQLELQIIEERLMYPSLSTAKMIKKLDLTYIPHPFAHRPGYF
jgi:hypothetical protein